MLSSPDNLRQQVYSDSRFLEVPSEGAAAHRLSVEEQIQI